MLFAKYRKKILKFSGFFLNKMIYIYTVLFYLAIYVCWFGTSLLDFPEGCYFFVKFCSLISIAKKSVITLIMQIVINSKIHVFNL